MSPNAPYPHQRPNEGGSPAERLRAWLRQAFEPSSRSPGTTRALEQQEGLTRRQFMGLFAAGAAGTALGMTALRGCDSKETPVAEKPFEKEFPQNQILDFFGHSVEILDQAHFDEQFEKARQYLLLKYSTPGKMIDENGKARNETNEEYWTRALETEFRGVLMEMDRYRDFIEEQAKVLGVSPDILAFFGIEAGFDPLKRSPSGYCGIAQIGVDAVRDVREHTICDFKIEEEGLDPEGDWYDERYHPLKGIANGVAYIGLLQKRFPKTVRELLVKYKTSNKAWLETALESGITRLESLEKKLNLPSAGSYGARYEALLARVLPSHEVAIADPGSFAICAYNMGEAGVSRQVLLNFIESAHHGTPCWQMADATVSALNLKTEEELKEQTDPPSSESRLATVTSLYVDMGHALRESDDERVTEERSTYLWQAYVFRTLAKQWEALKPGEAMVLPFKGKDYRLMKPQKPLPTYLEMMREVEVMDVPVGTDLVRLAEHLGLDESLLEPGVSPDHFDAFRRWGNAPLVRGIAVHQAPQKAKFQDGETIKIRIPKTKASMAQEWLSAEGLRSKAILYRMSEANASVLLRKLRANNPGKSDESISAERIFWRYNRMGKSKQGRLKRKEWLVLPGDLALEGV